MPGLYVRDTGGANRKLRELYGRDSGGTNRKHRELWGRDAGAVSRKVFSGYDCQAQIVEEHYTDTGYANIYADGSGRVGFYAINSPSGSNYVEIKLIFNEPITFVGSKSTFSMSFSNLNLKFAGNQYIRLYTGPTTDGSSSLIALIDEMQSGSMVTYSSTTYLNKTIDNLYLNFNVSLTARDDGDYSYFEWSKGGISIAGKQISSIEVI